MPSKEIEKHYNELRKRFALPDFREMDYEFEISDLEETNFLLRAIIRVISEKLDFYATVLQDILQPDASNLYAMHETHFFDEKEKKEMYDLYSRLMHFSRHSVELALMQNEKEEADFIINFHNEWKEIKNELLKFVNKMKASWKINTETKEDLGYLG